MPTRRCPRCRARMDHVRAPAKPDPVILDRCPHGHGLWFDAGELDQVLAGELAEDDAAFIRIKEFMGQFAAPPSREGEQPTP